MKKLLEKFLALSKKTRIISIVLAAVILCGIVVGVAVGVNGCNGSNENPSNSQSSVSESESSSSIEDSSSEEEPEIKYFNPKVGEPCQISFEIGEESAEGHTPAMGSFIISWTGNATVKYEGYEITNGAEIELLGARIPLMLYPTDTTVATEVVLTIAEISKEEVKTLVIGDNAIEFKGESVAYTFTAEEAGSYILSLAEGESNAAVSYEYFEPLFDQDGNPVLDSDGNQLSNPTTVTCESFPCEITLAQGQTITFYVSAKNAETLEDTINLIWSKKL